jgi:hypothetical protein
LLLLLKGRDFACEEQKIILYDFALFVIFLIMWCEEDELALAAATFIVMSGKKRIKRKYWTRPSLLERDEHGVPRLLESLQKDDILSGHIKDGHVKNFIRISSADLEWLLSKTGPLIQKNDTNCRKAISPLERLLITLRFLATGDSYASLMYLFRISKQSISVIVPEVCDAIVSVLQDHIQVN